MNWISRLPVVTMTGDGAILAEVEQDSMELVIAKERVAHWMATIRAGPATHPLRQENGLLTPTYMIHTRMPIMG